MNPRSTAIVVFAACVVVFAMPAKAQSRGGLDFGSGGCVKRGHWSCYVSHEIGTTYRQMQGTRFECGWGICSDTSHSQPESWVDIVGGVSNHCDDHSSSFWGPLGGEWNGCSMVNQISTGYQRIESADGVPWPDLGGIPLSNEGPSYCIYPYIENPPPPPGGMSSILDNYSAPVSGAFATVYDLDYCWDKQLIGTVYWNAFTVSGGIVTETPTYIESRVAGQAPVACATPENACTNDVLCADLAMDIVQVCAWVWDQPRTRCDSDC